MTHGALWGWIWRDPRTQAWLWAPIRPSDLQPAEDLRHATMQERDEALARRRELLEREGPKKNAG